jgi:hypothetical protein
MLRIIWTTLNGLKILGIRFKQQLQFVQVHVDRSKVFAWRIPVIDYYSYCNSIIIARTVIFYCRSRNKNSFDDVFTENPLSKE